VLLFYSGFFSFLFAVPLQVAYYRWGDRQGVKVAAVTAAAIVVVHLLQTLRFEEVGNQVVRIMLLDSLMPIGLLAGLSVFNIARGYPWWIRLLAGAAIAVAGALPSLRLLHQAVEGEGALAEQLTSMLTMLGVNDNAQAWIEMVQRVVFNSVGLGLTVAVAANWWIGRNIAFRGTAPVSVLRTARVPDRLIWAVIIGLAIAVAGWLRDVPLGAEILGWNTLLVASFLFAVQGIGIAQHLLVLRGVGPLGERWVLTGALVLMFLPGINVVVSIGLPLFGMSELWIDYKRGELHESDIEQ
jgi:hypothetical protein